jgi:cytochrome c553
MGSQPAREKEFAPMKTLLALASALALSLSAAAAAAPAPAQTAEQKAQTTCAACHAADGNSFNGEWPKLAGQHASYITMQLNFFRCHATKGADCALTSRRYDNPNAIPANGHLMIAQSAGLSDEDIAGLADYYSKQTLKPGVADAKLVEAGRKLYLGGNKLNATTACTACHGPDGRGNAAAKFPAIGGQHATYVAAQLRAFRDGSRRGDQNQMMRNISASLTDDEIAAVAQYVQGLR